MHKIIVLFLSINYGIAHGIASGKNGIAHLPKMVLHMVLHDSQKWLLMYINNGICNTSGNTHNYHIVSSVARYLNESYVPFMYIDSLCSFDMYNLYSIMGLWC